MDRHTGGQPPTLAARYFAGRRAGTDALEEFHKVVEDVLGSCSIQDPLVRRAIATMEASFSDSHLTSRVVAGRVGRQPEALASAFFAQMGLYPSEYLRSIRLDRSSVLLATTDKSVKEVWASVGYNHASNFDHDFKKRFGVSPIKYRAHAIVTGTNARREDVPTTIGRTALEPTSVRTAGPPQGRFHDRGLPGRGSILIVDDDQSTRETIGRYLTLYGYVVTVAASGEGCLQVATDLKPDAILLDYHLPDTNGLECLRALRRQDVGAAALIFSADWDLEDSVSEFRMLGAAFLSKLCDLEDIANAISAFIARITET